MTPGVGPVSLGHRQFGCRNSPGLLTNTRPSLAPSPLQSIVHVPTLLPLLKTILKLLWLKAVSVFSLTSSTSPNRFPLRLLFLLENKKCLTEPDRASWVDEAQASCCLSKNIGP
ncbi:hypothetical protein TNCV_673941 [Trichonephila clavipes]|uniref:Uncharacterized protein n=1 Tax=Trichonephila clavipes TaxID=2585209 RepID=A0A8X6WDZ1_TRICX|nr:hypothetical protein TNCV_673941 [Trichonephila clavipes]